jgi:hypothetical protein
MARQQVKLSGKVMKQLSSAGSKSEHVAMHLKTSAGDYVLRRKGGNPFYDETLMKLDGKEVIATGTINDYVFTAIELEEVK